MKTTHKNSTKKTLQTKRKQKEQNSRKKNWPQEISRKWRLSSFKEEPVFWPRNQKYAKTSDKEKNEKIQKAWKGKRSLINRKIFVCSKAKKFWKKDGIYNYTGILISRDKKKPGQKENTFAKFQK